MNTDTQPLIPVAYDEDEMIYMLSRKINGYFSPLGVYDQDVGYDEINQTLHIRFRHIIHGQYVDYHYILSKYNEWIWTLYRVCEDGEDVLEGCMKTDDATRWWTIIED